MSYWWLAFARKDLRSSWKTLSLSALSLVLGFALMALIVSLSQGFTSALQLQQKSLLGADLRFSSRRGFSEEVSNRLDRIAGEHAFKKSFHSIVSSKKNDRRRFAVIRGVTSNFPLYGEVVTEPPNIWSELDSGNIRWCFAPIVSMTFQHCLHAVPNKVSPALNALLYLLHHHLPPTLTESSLVLTSH